MRHLFAALMSLCFLLPAPPLHATEVPGTAPLKARLLGSLESLMTPVHTLLAQTLWPQSSGDAWVMPHFKLWPLDAQGHPIVETERVDELWHTLSPRHTLHWFRQRFHTTPEELQALNPDLDIRTLAPGDTVLAWRRAQDSVPQGIGHPNRGRLEHGEPLPLAEKYIVLYRHRSFGTYYTVSELKRLFDLYALTFPDALPVMIGDLSFRRGRDIPPHRSHHCGRDVDITYPRLTPPRDTRRFHRIRRHELDAPRTLWLIKQMLATGHIESIFMDRWIQEKLYHEATAQGAPQAWLDAVFQYPKWGGLKFLRRSHGHDDHMHIRFFEQPTDL